MPNDAQFSIIFANDITTLQKGHCLHGHVAELVCMYSVRRTKCLEGPHYNERLKPPCKNFCREKSHTSFIPLTSEKF